MVVLCDLTCVFYKRRKVKKTTTKKREATIYCSRNRLGWSCWYGFEDSPHSVFSHIMVVGIDDAHVLSVYECHLFSCAGADHVFFTHVYWEL